MSCAEPCWEVSLSRKEQRTPLHGPLSSAFRMPPSQRHGWNSSVNKIAREVISLARPLSVVLVAVLLFLGSPHVFAQAPQSGSDSDVDNLFNGSGDTSTPPANPPAPATPGASVGPRRHYARYKASFLRFDEHIWRRWWRLVTAAGLQPTSCQPWLRGGRLSACKHRVRSAARA